MKTKLTKILGVGIVVAIVASLMVFAAPVTAAEQFDPAPGNMWKGYGGATAKPTPGALGGWFYDPSIKRVGPIAEAINGDLYAYVELDDPASGSPADYFTNIFKSVDGGRTWSASIAPGKYAAGRVVDMVCSSLYEDVIYVTDGNYVYKSADGGQNFVSVGPENLELHIMGECGIVIVNEPITCIDVGYNGNDEPVLFIGTRNVGHYYPVGHATEGDAIVGTVLWITEESFPAEWSDLRLSCYGCCDIAGSVGGSATFDDTGVNAVAGDQTYSGCGLNNLPILPDGTFSIYNAAGTVETFTDPEGDGFLVGDNGGSGTINYATGCWTLVFGADPAATSDIEADYNYGSFLDGSGCYDAYAVGAAPDFNTTQKLYVLITTDDENCDQTLNDPATQVISSVGVTCSWSFVGELFYDCDVANPFDIIHGSRFAFPDDFTDTGTMFIGVAADTPHEPGGDVYRVTDRPGAEVLDLNVQGYSTACAGIRHANICSLDIKGGTDDGSLIAGVYAGATPGVYEGYEMQEPTNVYYSNDGGWTWASSLKDPTGRGMVYVLWYGETALAGTWGCDCGFSMSCGDVVGMFWNQISLINTCIDCVLDLSHAPGYIDGSSYMFMLTECDYSCLYRGPNESNSLFRWDGTYWERVWSSYFWVWGDPHWNRGSLPMDWVEASPDFNTTHCVYLMNDSFQALRTIDAGCSWAPLSYPCDPRPDVSAWIVVDEETVLVAGCDGAAGIIYKTDRHGTRPWDEFPLMDACCGVDFDLSPNIATDGSVLYGNRCGLVYISEDIGSTWDQIIDPALVPFTSDYTYVQFDPGYGTSGDPGETMVYATAGSNIARCNINPDALWMLQTWELIYSGLCYASGIDAAGDTALYVSDAGVPANGDGDPYVYGTLAVSYGTDPVGYTVSSSSCDFDIYNSSFEAITGLPCNEPLEIVAYNLECQVAGVTGSIVVRGLVTGYMARIFIAESFSPCYWCEPPGSAVEVISGDIEIVCPAVSEDCPAGVWRSLNPLDFIPPGVPFSAIIEFEWLTTGLYASSSLWHPMGSDDLWLTTSGMSNVLWCLDYNYCDYVWVWEDPLANPVTLVSPACGAQLLSPSGVTLEWNALDAATEYEINLYRYCAQCPNERMPVSVPNSADTCAIIGDLLPGTTYYWQVRVATGHPYLSKWSVLCEFTTALGAIPNLCSPPCGGDDVILNTNFSWDEVLGAAGYELQIVAAGADGTADFTGATTLTTDVNALASIPGLGYSTTYYWRVRAVTAGVPGAWAVCIFTTMDEPEEPLPPADLVVEIPADEEITPTWLWVLIGIGAALTVAVIILIVTTRRVP